MNSNKRIELPFDMFDNTIDVDDKVLWEYDNIDTVIGVLFDEVTYVVLNSGAVVSPSRCIVMACGNCQHYTGHSSMCGGCLIQNPQIDTSVTLTFYYNHPCIYPDNFSVKEKQ